MNTTQVGNTGQAQWQGQALGVRPNEKAGSGILVISVHTSALREDLQTR